MDADMDMSTDTATWKFEVLRSVVVVSNTSVWYHVGDRQSSLFGVSKLDR